MASQNLSSSAFDSDPLKIEVRPCEPDLQSRAGSDVVGREPVYVSFDIDSLDPAFAPGTGTPEVGGLTTRQALDMLYELRGLNIVGGDVVEVAPQYDPTTNTAQAAAQILFEIFCLVALAHERQQPQMT